MAKGAARSAERAGIEARLDALFAQSRRVAREHVLISRLDAFEAGGKIEPELKRMDALGPGHFAMHDAAARGHELDVAHGQTARAAGVIGMHELAVNHKRHRLDTPVRVGRETGRGGEPVLGHQEERAVLGDADGRNDHPGAVAFRARLGRAGGLDGADRKLHEQRP